jgi:hypothetical protein
MQKKHENVFSNNFFYVFVDLKPGNEKPDFYVVPSMIVAQYIKESHASYLKTLRKNGKQRKDTDMRFFEILNETTAAKYLNKWDNLGLT